MSGDAQRLIAVASVLGVTFSLEDIADVMDASVVRLLPAMREIDDDGIATATDTTFAFRDDATRQSVYDGISLPVRIALHHEIGMRLLYRGGSAVPAAQHLVHAARDGDRVALGALERATVELSATNPREAADFARQALDLTPAHDDARFARALTAVQTLITARRSSDAAELARRTLADDDLPPAVAASLRLILSGILFATGSLDDALVEAELVLAEDGLPDSCYTAAEVARLFALLGHDEFTRVREWAEEILAGGGRSGSDVALAAALSALSLLAWSEGRVADALGMIRAAVRRSDRADDAERRVHPRLVLAPMYVAIGELESAREMVEVGRREIERVGDTPWTMTPPIYGARIRLAAGDLEGAEAEAHSGLDMAEELGARFFVPLGVATLAEIALLRGDLREAARLVEGYRGEPAAPAVAFGADLYVWLEARLREAEEQPVVAMEILASVYDAPAAHKRLLIEQPGAAAWLVRVALAVGDVDRAQSVAGVVQQLADDNLPLACVASSAMHATGLLRRDAGALCSAAGNHWSGWARASAAEDAGRVYRDDRQTDAAREEFTTAISDYDRAGATRDAARVRKLLVAAAAPDKRRARNHRPVEGWDSLTNGERRVVELVAEGLTNRQAAERASLSRHTVDFHLRQAFRKLNVGSRVELTRYAIENQQRVR
ncbi:MAG TPA: LuxR C-terminal-related transcriptional regulator [Acidimicrobiia bacterium]|nr:LuxR C-terminal-related transcriptional regulator [Acidimicrobiia bacterium]